MKTIRIVLLLLIIIGISLLVTQKLWVPKLVTSIMQYMDEVDPSQMENDLGLNPSPF